MRLFLIALLLLSACTRPLSEGERAFTATIHGATLNADAVRISKGALIGNVSRTRAPRPALTCREKIRRPEVGPVRVSTAAFVLFNRMFAAERIYSDDYMASYPQAMSLPRAMFIAHEMTHVWQWQNRHITGYHPLKAAAEHAADDPYLFDLAENPDFLSFGYEQQGGIVEEFVCCRTLDPTGARTARLHALLTPYFPELARTEAVPRANVILPWEGAETRGICS